MINLTSSRVIQIDSFLMRPLQLSDFDALVAIWIDPEVTRFLPSQGIPISREKAENSLQYFLEHWQQRG